MKRGDALLHVPRGASPPCRNKGPWNKSSIYWLVRQFVARGGKTQGGVMTTLQAVCLGAMLAWTPSLVVLALLLREAPLDELERNPS